MAVHRLPFFVWRRSSFRSRKGIEKVGPRKILAAALAPAALVLACVAGADSYSADLSQQPAVFDTYGRLTGYPEKKAVACPVQDRKTAVLLLIGQSNTGNHAEREYTSAYKARVLNYFNGKCYVAESPLLGTTGSAGESWTLLGNKLVAAGAFRQVILVPAGINGSPISRWREGGDLNEMLMGVLAATRKRYRITHILWHQGEVDFIIKTGEDDYRGMFGSLLSTIREQGIDAPMFVSVATKCAPEWNADNPVARAQKVLPSLQQKVFAGVDTDSLVGDADRHDTCHFGATGQEKFAQAWLDIINQPR